MALKDKQFEQLFKEHFTGLCTFAVKIVRDTDTAKEIAHDVFINLWEKRETISPEKPIKSYLYTSVHNRCLNYIRDNRKFEKDEQAMERLAQNYTEPTNEQIDEAELESRVATAINRLPGKCREIFVLSRYEDLKYSEIAERLGIAVKTVEAQMSKALRLLRDYLKDYMGLIILFYRIVKGMQDFGCI